MYDSDGDTVLFPFWYFWLSLYFFLYIHDILFIENRMEFRILSSIMQLSRVREKRNEKAWLRDKFSHFRNFWNSQRFRNRFLDQLKQYFKSYQYFRNYSTFLWKLWHDKTGLKRTVAMRLQQKHRLECIYSDIKFYWPKDWVALVKWTSKKSDFLWYRICP